jgi:cytidine deaminase
MTDDELLTAAHAVRDKAYCPYSHFKVGAALLDDKGRLHIGCNVENAAYSNVQCAEASTIGAMVAAGGQKIATIAIVGGGESLRFCPPCGGCRQRILEFANDNTRIILQDEKGAASTFSIDDLLPTSFKT